MREILFRGKKKKDGHWVQGGFFVCKNFKDEDEYNISNNGYLSDVIPETVGQFIGLTDINGTKIFEGDILENGAYIGVVTAEIYNCSCCHCVYGFSICDSEGVPIDDMHFVDSEKIGNIYDNPELLKERKKC